MMYIARRLQCQHLYDSSRVAVIIVEAQQRSIGLRNFGHAKRCYVLKETCDELDAETQPRKLRLSTIKSKLTF